MKLQLNGDDVTCVSACEGKTFSEDEKTKELKCVDKCEHWWYKEQSDGLCKKEAWRKNTAIAIPIAVVAIAVIVVLVFLLVKGKKGPKAATQSTGMNNVATPNRKTLGPVDA